MRLYTPKGLLYPIKVTRLLRQAGDSIEENAPLFDYEYKSKVIEGHWDTKQGGNVDKEVERTWPATFESELEGSLNTLSVTVGQVITGRTAVADVEEACKHEVQFGGLCAECGKDMKEVNYNSTVKGTDRATVNTIHDRHGMHTVLVSQDETLRAHEENKAKLLKDHRLSLVVDLDQTVIQCCVDQTVGDWMEDPSNPNYEALKGVAKFNLPRDEKTYYVKSRPGLQEFLDEMSEYYEMHVYTMASRDYAHIVARIIDPEGKYFGNRVLSRDESGSHLQKSLQRLFPVDTRMVVIIDDRGDVWQHSPNLARVNAYDFFVGVGDINSSFLPKKQELPDAKPKPMIEVAEKKEKPAETDTISDNSEEPKDATNDAENPPTPPMTPPTANGGSSAVDLMVSMAGNQAEATWDQKQHEHDETLAHQLADRPLLQKQRILDAAEEEAKDGKDSPAVEEATAILKEDGEKEPTPTDHPRYRHNLLQDDDTELRYLGRNLLVVHNSFYESYDTMTNVAGEAARVAELRTGKQHEKPAVEELQVENIPDAAMIMSGLKSDVLADVHLVFSGMIPLGYDVRTQDIVIWARSFGASVSEAITKKTTHVIATPDKRTAKVRQAVRKCGRIAIVSSGWLFSCFQQWARVDEGPFRIHSDAPSNGTAGLPESFEDKELGTLSSSDEEAALTETENESELPGDVANGSQRTNDADPELEAELKKFAPTDERDGSDSPKENVELEDGEYDKIDAEWKEFMGSDDEWSDSSAAGDSDNESEQGGAPSANSTPGQKRKRDDAADAPTSDPEGSRLQKRKKEALGRTSSLTNMASAGATSTDGEDGAIAAPVDAKNLDGIDEEDDDSDLEAMLAAEMEKDDDDGGEADGET